jgi:hypothetical protein
VRKTSRYCNPNLNPKFYANERAGFAAKTLPKVVFIKPQQAMDLMRLSLINQADAVPSSVRTLTVAAAERTSRRDTRDRQQQASVAETERVKLRCGSTSPQKKNEV